MSWWASSSFSASFPSPGSPSRHRQASAARAAAARAARTARAASARPPRDQHPRASTTASRTFRLIPSSFARAARSFFVSKFSIPADLDGIFFSALRAQPVVRAEHRLRVGQHPVHRPRGATGPLALVGHHQRPPRHPGHRRLIQLAAAVIPGPRVCRGIGHWAVSWRSQPVADHCALAARSTPHARGQRSPPLVVSGLVPGPRPPAGTSGATGATDGGRSCAA